LFLFSLRLFILFFHCLSICFLGKLCFILTLCSHLILLFHFLCVCCSIGLRSKFGTILFVLLTRCLRLSCFLVMLLNLLYVCTSSSFVWFLSHQYHLRNT